MSKLPKRLAWKRQIQRLMARGKFPKPDGIPTEENRWRLSVIVDWLEQRNADQITAISDRAVTDPAKLKPEQLNAVLSSAFNEWAHRSGASIEDGSAIVAVPPSAHAQAAQCASDASDQGAQLLADAFARLDPMRGLARRRRSHPGVAPGR
jgi:hypothetical protein